MKSDLGFFLVIKVNADLKENLRDYVGFESKQLIVEKQREKEEDLVVL